MKKFLPTLKGIVLFSALSALFSLNIGYSQAVNTHVFSTSTGVALAPAGGYSPLLGALQDDAASPLTAIGFNFTFGGTVYSSFSASSNGLVQLGSVAQTTYTNALSTIGTGAFICPLWDDLYTASNGNVQYKVLGSSPNRKLVIEWNVSGCCPGTAFDRTFQLWLFETTNVVEFVYGAGVNSGNGGWTPAIATDGASVYNTITTSTNTNSTSTYNDGDVTWPGNGRAYIFTPCAATGNPAVSPTGQWNVYCYNAGDAVGGSGAWTTNYSGFYSIPFLNFDTQTGQANSTPQSWTNTLAPSSASGYTGCAVGVDNHSYIFKRTGVPTCGTYRIDALGHDDAAILFINGVEVWRHVNGCCDVHTGVWTGFLDGSSVLEYRISEGAGGSNAGLTFTPIAMSGTVTGTNPVTCGANGTVTVSNPGGAYCNISSSGFGAVPPGSVVSGSASITGEECVLTPVVGGVVGSLDITPTIRPNFWEVTYNQFIGGGSGADGMSFAYGTGGLGGESGFPTGLTVSFDTYDNGSGTTNSRVYVYYNSGLVASNALGSFNLRTSSYLPVRITVNASNQITVVINGATVISAAALPASYLTDNKTTWHYGFSARTGGLNDMHKIDNYNLYAINYAEYSTDGTTWQTSNVFNKPAGSYTVQMRALCGTACVNSSIGSVTLTDPALPQGSLTANGPFCTSGTGQLTFTATAGTGPYTVVYFDGVANRTVSGVVSGTPFSVFTNPVVSTTNYSLVSVTGSNSCVRSSGFTGGTATITINSLSVAPTGITGTTSICAGGSTILTVSGGSLGTGAVTQWFAGSCGGTLVGTGNSITVSPGTSTTYFVRYSGTCNTTACASATVTVNTIPTIACSGPLTVNIGPGICNATISNAQLLAQISSVTGSPAPTVTFVPAAGNFPIGTTSVTATASNGCAPAATCSFNVIVTAPEINVQGNAVTIVDGDITPNVGDFTDFGNQSVCSGTVVKTYTIQNTGTSNLSVTSVTLTGANAADYSITVAPASTVAAAGSTTFQITFNPSALGLRTATINIATNDCDETTYDYSIQGTGVDPEANVIGNLITILDEDITPSLTDLTDFGSVSVCSGTISRSFTIQNLGTSNLNLIGIGVTGGNSGDFTLSGSPSSPIAPGGTTSFQFTFNPSAAGLRTTTIQFGTNDCDENPYNFMVQGTGTDPEINVQGNAATIVDGDVTPSLTDFTDFGTGVLSRVYAIQNTGNAVLNISSITLTGANAAMFNISGAPASVIAGGSATFTVNYNPTVAGIHNATVNINNNDCDEALYDYAITATSVVGAALDFDGSDDIVLVTETPALLGLGPVGFTLEAWVKPTNVAGLNSVIRKSGDYNLYLNGNVIGAEVWPNGEGTGTFKIFTGTTSLTAGVWSHIAFVWDPVTGTGTLYKDGVLDPSSNITSSVAGDDFLTLGGSITYNQPFLGNIDEVRIWNRVLCQNEIQNNRSCEIPVSSANLIVNYHFNQGVSIGNNSGLTTLTDASGGDNNGTLANFTLSGTTSNWVAPGGVTSGTACVPFTDPEINLVGNSVTIVDGDASPTTADHTDFGSVLACSGTIVRTFTIQNTGTANLTFSAPVLSGANAGDFAITTAPVSPVSAGGSTTFQVTFDPSTTGLRSATITINNNDCSEAVYDFAIQGTGNADIVNPTITCPANISVNNAINTCGAVVTYTAPIGTDNCPSPTTTQIAGLASGATYPVGVTTNTFRVTDGSGNTAVCSFTVTVNDTQLPAISCPANISVNNAINTCGAVVTYTAPIGTDNCPGATTAQIAGLASGATYPVGVTTNTFRVTDASGNQTTCSFTVTVNDAQLPAISCPANISVNNAINTCGAVVTYTAPIGTDNCPGATTAQIAGLASGATYPVGVTTNTFRVTDASGNQTTCSFTVTVNDAQLPAITCPANITVGNTPGFCSAVVTYTAPIGTDNCPGATTSQIAGLASGATYPVGVTTNTFRVTDGSGNQTTCSFTVTVNDTQAPTVTSPSTVDLECASDLPPAVTTIAGFIGLPGASASDNCTATGSLTISSSTGSLVGTSCNGTITRTYTITDAALNSTNVNHVFTITDNTAPVAVAPSTVDLECASDLPAAVTTIASFNSLLGASSSDNCSPTGSLTVSSSTGSLVGTSCNGTITRTYTISDVCGNSTNVNHVFTVTDNTAPVINCPANITQNAVPLNCGKVVTYSIPTATDNCGSVTITQTDGTGYTSGQLFPVGVTTLTYTATDVCGNSSSCSFSITIIDNQNPIITSCPSNITVNNTAGACNRTVSWIAPTASDNCPGVTMISNFTPGSTFPVGTTTVIYTATDVSLNTTTCSFTVTVNDTEVPVVTCPTVSNPYTADAGECNATLSLPASSTDNCGIASTVYTVAGLPISFPYDFPLGNTTVSVLVTDVHSNTANCSFVVTVEDHENPAISCAGPINVNADAGTCTYVSSQLTAPVGTDNCSVASIVASPSSLVAGANTVTWTVTDGSGNTGTCTQIVTVIDSQNPTISCAGPINVNADPGTCTYASSQLTAPIASDNCSLISVVASPSVLVSGPNTVTWTATDGAGLTATCLQTITVLDTQSPTITCAGPINVNADPGVCTYASSQLTAPSASDNCSVASVVSSPSSLVLGPNTVTWTVTDGAGLTATCIQTVTVLDTQNPTITCAGPVNVNADPGACTYASSQLTAPISSDNCSVTSVVASPSSLVLGPNTVTWTVTDGAGLTGICTQIVTVIDNQLPVALCQPITVHLDGSGQAVITGAMINNGSSDNCGIASLTASPSILTCANLGANSVTLTVTDGSGNSSTCTAIVTLTDTIVPTAICQNISIDLDAFGNAIITPAQVDNGSHDNPISSGVIAYTYNFDGTTMGWTSALGGINCLGNNFGTNTWALQTNAFAGANSMGVTTVGGEHSFIQSPILNLSGATSITFQSFSNNENGYPCSYDVELIDISTDGGATWTNMNGGSVANLNDVYGDNQWRTITLNTTIPSTTNGRIRFRYDTGDGCCGPSGPNTGWYVDNVVISSVGSTPCFPVTLAVDQTNFNCSDVGTNTVVLTVSDGSGNSSTCTSTVTVNDVTAPTIVCGGTQNINLDATCSAILPDYSSLATAADACGPITITQSPAPGTIISGAGSMIITLTVTDGSLNATSCSFTLNKLDVIDPVIVCPADVVVNNDAGICGAVVTYTTPTATDNCSLSINYSLIQNTNLSVNTSLACGPGNTTATARYYDLVGMGVTGNFTVNSVSFGVWQTSGPDDPITVNIYALPSFPIPFGSMPAPVYSGVTLIPSSANFTVMNYTIPGGAVIPAGSNMVYEVVGDGTANNFLIGWHDTGGAPAETGQTYIRTSCVGPDYLTPQSIGFNGFTTIMSAFGSESTSGATVVQTAGLPSGSTFPVGTSPVTFVATDGSGNTDTCSFNIIVNDTEAPTITCPGTQTLNLTATCSVALPDYTGLATTGDNCAGVVTVSQSPAPGTLVMGIGATTITLTATDAALNSSMCSFSVNRLDVTAPVPNIASLPNVNGLCSITPVAPTATDACNGTITATTATPFPIVVGGTTVVTWIYTDASGNSSTQTQTVVVSSPEADIFGNGVGIIHQSSAYAAANNTDFGSTTVCNGTITKTYVIQNNGIGTLNLTGSPLVKITGLNPGDFTVISMPATSIPQGGSTSFSIRFNPSGTGARYARVTVNNDDCNESGYYYQIRGTGSGTDNVAPVPNLASLPVITGSCNAIVSTIPTATDACAGLITGTTTSALTYSAQGSYTVIWSYNDGNGNTSTQTQMVLVQDLTPPTANCQPVVLELNTSGNITLNAGMINNGSFDNCGPLTFIGIMGAVKVVNGTFTGSLSPWTTSNGTTYMSTGGNPGGFAWMNGSNSATSDPSVQQTYSDLIPGATYVVRGDYKTVSGTGTPGQVAFGIDLDGTQIATKGLPNPITSWTPFTVTFTATSSSHTLRFRGEINGTDGDIALDNIRIDGTAKNYNCFTRGVNNITLVVMDGYGNTASCNTTATIQSTVNPCPFSLPIDPSGVEEQVNNNEGNNEEGGNTSSIENNNNFGGRIYPNPSNGIFNLELSTAPRGKTELRVLDQLGQVLYVTQLTSQTSYFDLSYLRSATYYIQVISEEGSFTKTIIVTQQY